VAQLVLPPTQFVLQANTTTVQTLVLRALLTVLRATILASALAVKNLSPRTHPRQVDAVVTQLRHSSTELVLSQQLAKLEHTTLAITFVFHVHLIARHALSLLVRALPVSLHLHLALANVCAVRHRHSWAELAKHSTIAQRVTTTQVTIHVRPV